MLEAVRFKVPGAGLTDLEARAPEPFLTCGGAESPLAGHRAASFPALLFTAFEFRPIPVRRNLLLGIAKLLPQIVPVKRETLQVVSLAMTGLMRGWGPVFHIVKTEGGCDLSGMGKDSLFGTVSHGRGWGCRGVAKIENKSFSRPPGTSSNLFKLTQRWKRWAILVGPYGTLSIRSRAFLSASDPVSRSPRLGFAGRSLPGLASFRGRRCAPPGHGGQA